MKLTLLIMVLTILASSLRNKGEPYLEESHKVNHNHHLKNHLIDVLQQHQLFNSLENNQHQANYHHSADCSSQIKLILNAYDKCQVQNLTETSNCVIDFFDKASLSTWNFVIRQKNVNLSILSHPKNCSTYRDYHDSFRKNQRTFYLWRVEPLSETCLLSQLDRIRDIIDFCRKNKLDQQDWCIINKIKAEYNEIWNLVINPYQIITHWFKANQIKYSGIVNLGSFKKNNCFVSYPHSQSDVVMVYTVWKEK